MMSLYIGLGVLLILAAILVLLSLRSREISQDDAQLHRRAQRDFYRQRQRELRSDLDSGLIDQTQFAELERDLDRQLVAESATRASSAVTRPKRIY